MLFLNNLKAQTTINTEALNFPVLISINQGYGSGFFYLDSLDYYLVTAKHVIFDFTKPKVNGEYPLKGKIGKVEYYDRNSNTSTFHELFLDLEYLLNTKTLIYNNVDDVLVIPICTLTLNKESQWRATFSLGITLSKELTLFTPRPLDKNYVRKFKDVNLGNDIYLLGYPKSLGLQRAEDYNFNIPLLRKGTLAGKNILYKNLIIDCPAFGGNSGGPVFNFAKNQGNFGLVGIVVSFIPYVQPLEINAQLKVPNLVNSGYSVVEPIDKVLDLIASKK